MTSEEKARRMNEARVHLRFFSKVYKHQAAAGRYFVHEHPHNAVPWDELEMKQMLRREGSILADTDQCQHAPSIEDTTDGR